MPPKRQVSSDTPPSGKKAKSHTGLAQGPIRWEHCFSADFGPQWHLAYTSDEAAKSAQRNQWIEELIGSEQNEFEARARSDFNYLNYISFLKFNFKVFECVMRSCWSGPLAPAKLDKSIKAESIVDPKDMESPADSGDSAFLVLNGSIKLAMDSSRPFVVGRWQGNNSNIAVPDLNVKNIVKSAASVKPRHCAIVHGSIVPSKVDRSHWYLVNYTKDPITVGADTACNLNDYVTLTHGCKILIGTEIFLRFFIA
jgi:hypothetical protein